MSRFSIMVGGDSLAEVTANIHELVNALGFRSSIEASAVAPVARTRGRPAKVVAEEAPAPVAAPVAPPAAPAADPDKLKAAAIAALVKLINANDALGRDGKQVCTDLCTSHGGKNVSAINPANYPALIDSANKALDDLNSNPAA